MAERVGLEVFVVSNGSRPIRPSQNPSIKMVIVAEGADAADDWIAERITQSDICVTNDIPLASRCLKKSARALAANGNVWTDNNIGNALAGREVGRYLRETGINTGGPPPFSKADRSRFLNALDAVVQAALRDSGGRT